MKLVISRPCRSCTKFLMKISELICLNNIIYIDDNQNIYSEKLLDLYPKTSYSSGCKKCN